MCVISEVGLKTWHSIPVSNDHAFNSDTPRKRRKLDPGSQYVDESQWLAFAQEVEVFNVQHVHGQGRFAFGFVEGPLVQALKNGHW